MFFLKFKYLNFQFVVSTMFVKTFALQLVKLTLLPREIPTAAHSCLKRKLFFVNT